MPFFSWWKGVKVASFWLDHFHCYFCFYWRSFLFIFIVIFIFIFTCPYHYFIMYHKLIGSSWSSGMVRLDRWPETPCFRIFEAWILWHRKAETETTALAINRPGIEPMAMDCSVSNGVCSVRLHVTFHRILTVTQTPDESYFFIISLLGLPE